MGRAKVRVFCGGAAATVTVILPFVPGEAGDPVSGEGCDWISSSSSMENNSDLIRSDRRLERESRERKGRGEREREGRVRVFGLTGGIY